MPELPEVETTRRGVAPHVEGLKITAIDVRQPKLRWLVPDAVQQAVGLPITAVRRRAKYLLFDTDAGAVVLHLGMSGSLTVQPASKAPGKHDHIDFVLEDGHCLRLNDPRRFGACLWQGYNAPELDILSGLGPEPLTAAFDGQRLFERSRKKTLAVKNYIMTNAIVVGVGNIYANEALFMSGIHPRRAAGQISRARYELLAVNIKAVLAHAIEQGGTTLRDFKGVDGKPGYFSIQLKVYGKSGEACPQCGGAIRSIRIGQRNSFYCPRCQRG